MYVVIDAVRYSSYFISDKNKAETNHRNHASESGCGGAGDVSDHLLGGPRDAAVLHLLQGVAQRLLSLGGGLVRQVRGGI